MNTSSKLVLIVVTVFLLTCSTEVECRRTYSSRSSSSGRGNRGKNQPSSGGLFSSWFGGSKSSGSSSGSIAKPAPTSAKKNWQTASSHATSQSKSNSNWANPYYKPAGSAQVPSAPKEPSYGWKPAGGSNANAKPVGSYPSSNIGSRGYPVQTGVQQQGSQAAFGGYKPASGYQPSQTNFGGYRPGANVPNTHGTNYHPSGHQTNYGGYHSATNLHPSQSSHGYQPSLSHQPSYHPSAGTHHVGAYPHQTSGFSGYHPPYTGYSPHTSFGGAVPSYQGSKLFGGSTGHYGYPGSGSWGIDTYGSRKSSGTGKLLTGLAVGAAGGYLTSSLVNRISNPWKYAGYGYGGGYGGYGGGYGSSYDYARARDESAFERGFERGVQSRQQNENMNNKDTAAPPTPEDPSSKWVQCVAFDPQTQQTLINPNCSCTVTTSVDERTGQPLSVHHCTTLNGLVMQPVPIQPFQGNTPPSSPVSGQPLGTGNAGGLNSQPLGGSDVPPSGLNGQQNGGISAAEATPFYGGAYQGEFHYTGGPTIYLPPRAEPKPDRIEVDPKLEQTAKETALLSETVTETKSEPSMTERKLEQSSSGTKPEEAASLVPTSEKMSNSDPTEGGIGGGAPPMSEKLAGGLQENHKRTAEFYGQLQKIVNMGNFVDGA